MVTRNITARYFDSALIRIDELLLNCEKNIDVTILSLLKYLLKSSNNTRDIYIYIQQCFDSVLIRIDELSLDSSQLQKKY